MRFTAAESWRRRALLVVGPGRGWHAAVGVQQNAHTSHHEEEQQQQQQAHQADSSALLPMPFYRMHS
uniref:Secreted protein n=1 Tax=Knipowitschia caucasica TaxID=637954 RepID=A0AAV2JQT4_KNICA